MNLRALPFLAYLPGVILAQQTTRPDSGTLVRLSLLISARLTQLATEERRRFHEDLRFTDRVVDVVAQTNVEGFATIFLEASDSGWSAVVLHNRIPGTACGTYFGVVSGRNRPSAVPGAIACTGDWADLIHPPPIPLPMGRIHLATEPELEARPVLIECPSVELPNDLRRTSATVRLSVVIDSTGMLEQAPIRVTQAPTFTHARAAIWTVAQCRWKPGRLPGRTVRTAGRLVVHLGAREPVADTVQ
jgi:hypothetical protein